MCQLSIGPRKKSRMSGEGKETLSCRTAASLSPSRPKAAFVPAANGLQFCRRERSATSKRERNRCYGDNQIHANPQSGGRRSHGVTCLWPLAPKTGTELAKMATLMSRARSLKIGAPRRCYERRFQRDGIGGHVRNILSFPDIPEHA